MVTSCSPHDPDPPAPHTPEWCELVDHVGAQALGAAVARHIDCAVQTLHQAAHLPGQPFDRMMVGWADTMLAYLGLRGQLADDVSVELGFARTGTLAAVPTEQVPPVQLWAGRFVAARAAMDHDTLGALMATDPTMSYPERILAVLAGVATTLRERELRNTVPTIPAQATGS